MIERTPVLGILPKYLQRITLPQRTPIIQGRPASSISDLMRKSKIDLAEVESAIEFAGITCGEDKYWAMVGNEAIRHSCALFASEKLRGPRDAPYFGHFILGKHHLEWDELLFAFLRLNILAARDHGKSYFWTFAYPIWRAKFWAGCLIYIFSAIQKLSENFLKMIKEEILNNPELEDLIPPSRDRYWSVGEIKLRNGSVIRARGYGVKVRGGHPDFIVCDDVLGDDDIYSETIRRRNIDYYLSSITNMIVPGGQIVVVGTPMHQGDLYNTLRENPEYTCRSYPALTNNVPLFPERYSYDALQAKRRELKSEARFAREFMCQPLTDEASLFPSRFFEGTEVRKNYVLGLPASYWEERKCLRYTGVDIALSAEVGADYFWIFTIAVDPEGNRWLANLRRGHGWSFHRQIDEIKDEYFLMLPEVVHIESNQAQRVWTDEIQRTTDIPVRRFFTTGIGGRQPLEPWKRGATKIAVNKNHIERGVPGLRMTLEAAKWRIPRGDQRSVELTDIWIGEMTAMGWIDGKVQSVAEHDDSVMACWMADTAARLGSASRFSWLDDDIRQMPPATILAAPPSAALAPVAAVDDLITLERKALANVQSRQPVECTLDSYCSRIRSALQNYAAMMIDAQDSNRAIYALEEVKRLDNLYRLGDHSQAFADFAQVVHNSTTAVLPIQGAPAIFDLYRD